MGTHIDSIETSVSGFSLWWAVVVFDPRQRSKDILPILPECEAIQEQPLSTAALMAPESR